MAGETKTATSMANHDEQYCGAEFNPFNVSNDKEIVDLISTDIVDGDETFKCFPVFLVVKSILERSCQILDEEIGEVKQAKEKGRMAANTKFNLPLLVLQQIAAELILFKNQTEAQVSHSTTVRILGKLSRYPWEAKAVLVLLAFAMEFRDFSHPLSQIRQISADQEVDQSLAILQNVLVFIKSSSDVRKFQQQIHGELKIFKDCIKATVQVMEMVIKLEKLSSVYDKEGHSSSASQQALVVHSYWVIMAIVACATKITILTSYDEDNKLQDHLEHYTGKLNIILDSLTKKLNALNAEAKLYWELTEIFTAPGDTADILLAMAKPSGTRLRDCAKQGWVEINPFMKGKKVFIFIADQNTISDYEISLMKETQKQIDQDPRSNLSCVLWIAISEVNWNDKTTEVLNMKRGKMTCYDMAVSPNRPVALRYIKEEWNYKGEMMLVVINEHGIIESSNAAFHLLRHWGMEAFPFDKEAERRISEKLNWPKTIVSKMKPHDSTEKDMKVSELNEWMKDERRYIFFYGGRNEAWMEKFQETVKSVEQNLNTDKETKLSYFCVGKTIEKRDKENKEGNVSSQFWSGIEKWLLDNEDSERFESEIKQVEALLSYKYQKGWVLLCGGPRAVISGHGETMLKTLEEFKSNLEKDGLTIDQKSNTFEKVFKECYKKIIKETGCCQLQVEMHRMFHD